MQGLARLVMRGPTAAIATVAVVGTAALWFPPLEVLVGGSLGLVTLRLGARPGLQVALGSLALAGLATLLLLGTPWAGALALGGYAIPLWGVALLLRTTGSLSLALEAATGLGLVVATALHLAIADPVGWWRQRLDALLAGELPAGSAQGAEAADRILDQVAGLMNGAVGLSVALSLMLGLLLARYWQAVLYNPGGLREEFHHLRLGRNAGLIGLAALAGALVTSHPLLHYYALVLAVPFVFQGLAMVHGLIGVTGIPRAWLIGFYVLAALTLPHSLVLVLVAGLLDTWMDFRARAAGS